VQLAGVEVALPNGVLVEVVGIEVEI
jgi:hypothetical protein